MKRIRQGCSLDASASCTIFRDLILLCCGGVTDLLITFFFILIFCQNAFEVGKSGLLLCISSTCFSFWFISSRTCAVALLHREAYKSDDKTGMFGKEKVPRGRNEESEAANSTLTENSARININNCTCNITESSFLLSASLSPVVFFFFHHHHQVYPF